MKFNFYFVSLSMLLLICLFTPARSVAQSGSPGGVAGLKHWYNISSSPEQGQAWKDRIGKDGISLQLIDGQYDYLNGNPVLQLNSRLEPIQLPIASSTIDRSTMISLYHARDTFREQIIWRMANPSQAGLVLSTHRLGDVSNGRYFKTSAQLALHPILHTYVQHQRGKADAQTANWFIGHTGELGNLPVVQFAGSLPELLIYDRVLSLEEQLRVNSHLAIQYGISLPSSDYLNAAGEVIWGFKENQDYPYHITGIAHDPVSGLHQRRSSSQMTSTALMELSAGPWTSTNAANQVELPSGVSLIWSDNGERLRFDDQENSSDVKPALLERRWLMDISAGGEQLSTTLRLHIRNLEKLVQPKEEVWLAVDQKGTGDFEYAHTHYYPGTKGEEEVMTFEDVKWDQDRSGKDVFTFVLGKPMIPVLAVEQPRCSTEASAQLRMKVYGGMAPYTIRWVGDNKDKPRSWELDAQEELTWSEPQTGYYTLEITDARGETYRRTIPVQNEDAPSINLLSAYTLGASEPLILSLDTPSGGYSSVQWIQPNGSIVNTASLKASEPGSYQVRVEADGCAREHRFELIAAPDSFVEEWQLFPNPSGIGENFDLRVSLHQAQPLEISLMDNSGRVISSEKRNVSAFHTYQNRIQHPGVYQIVLRSGKEQMSLPVVVQ